jgi:hypothetical protein
MWTPGGALLVLFFKARFKMDQRIQDIDYATCHFGFSKLKGSGALAPEVQRQLRSLKLAAGKITRS